MDNLFNKRSVIADYRNRHYLDTIEQAEQVLEQYGNRRTEYNAMRRSLEMTKCMCERIEDPLVMTRQLLSDTVKFNRNNQRLDTIDEVIDLLNKHRNLWFSQSLTSTTQSYWTNRIKVAEMLMTELEDMKCQNT